MRDQFLLTEELVKIQDITTYYIPNETEIAGKSDHDLARYLNEITDGIQVSSENISDPLIFDKIRSFLKYFPNVQPRILSRLFDIILSAFRVEVKSTAEDLDNNDKQTFSTHRFNLELYGFLVHWFIMLTEEHTSVATLSASSSSRKSKSASSNNNNLKTYDWNPQKSKAFDLASWLLGLKITKLWTMTPERLAFVTLFTKPAYQVFENPANVKSASMKERVFRILGLCIKHYDHMPVAQTTIMQNLQYWEHSAESMAELLVYMIDKLNYTQLADEILREIGNREFKDVTNKELKDSPNPKTFGAFLQKLAELAPKTILKNLTVLISLLDSESYQMRVTLIEILILLIIELSKGIEDNPNNIEQINGFFDLLEERMLDTSSYCRQKVLQAYLRLFSLKTKFPKRRYAAAVLCVRHLQDKSSLVRKYAIRALTALVSTHPFSMYGGELDSKEWKTRLEKLKKEIEYVTTEEDVRAVIVAEAANATASSQSSQNKSEEVDDDTAKVDNADEDLDMADASGHLAKADKESNLAVENEEQQNDTGENNESNESVNAHEEDMPNNNSFQGKTIVSAEKLQQLILMRQFHVDAVQFIELLQKAIPITTQLLSSKSKAEVLESMDFLVTCYNYKVDLAADGIKKMLHLIWTKDTSDEGKGIKMRLLSSYENLYIAMDSNLDRKQNINRIAKNLIQLTYNTTLAELTSLEQLLSVMMAEGKISNEVIQKLWSVYGFTQGRIQKSQRRGAIIILGMLAKAKTSIVADKIDVMLKIGLGFLGKADLELAKYTCIALQRLEGAKERSRSVQEGVRFLLHHAMFTRLKDIIEQPTESHLWFSMAEQAINTIYLLCKDPEAICEELIRNKTNKVFGSLPKNNCFSMSPSPAGTDTSNFQQHMDSTLLDYDLSMTQQVLPFPQHPLYQSPMELSQLFFLVGHVALKEIVHLEIVEAAWKRKKSEKVTDLKKNKKKKNKKSKKKKDTDNDITTDDEVEPIDREEEVKEEEEEDDEEDNNDAAMEDELDQVGGGTAEDDIGDAMTRIREREILFGPNSLLGVFGPLITEVCVRNKIYTDRTLQINATLALTKLMCVSSDFCEQKLQLLFTILEKSRDPSIRSNIVIGLGDMAVCFNTLIDDNITFLYNRLSDADTVVRKNAVMVLTHLILNGMVKVKGQISEMAKCLEDEDPRISDLAKLFFTELASKDNAIYNNLPDIISSLTTPSHVNTSTTHAITDATTTSATATTLANNDNVKNSRLDEESFRKIMKFIFSFDFTEKEKQAENIVDKLCQRFLTAEDERSWRDIAYCLSLLPFKTEKPFKKLLEGWPTYQDKLHEDAVHKSFLEIIQKGRLNKNQRPELKTLIDELDRRVEKQRGAAVSENEEDGVGGEKTTVTLTKKGKFNIFYHKRGEVGKSEEK
ncbi:non-SMC mitotic condensation complex subunit 1-domain-containing protein [Mycotypha africana]|uniref:non-SMC mitotic condensation complex subunit 1-domain-containing protein n=1 Tax=Mycotypha africana TaxID=64632 RepID=UPI002300BC4A|nr:non-SMC mitotic condensation complex subunit 1-domain-containing protein [Mycotypha africana]KAI8991499.1 non-SMC mitotic condensation complex subunit 1-domain-containing protein [Mycotypha africana]